MKISSGNKDFDILIDNGYANCITTFYGPAASGKTTFCLLAAVEQAKNNKRIIFLDTENGFSVERIKQIVNNKLDCILDNIIIIYINNFKAQQDKIKNLIPIVKTGKFSLVIVDSLGAHYRKLVKSKPDLANKMLISQLRILKEVSKICPVLITNQVYEDIDQKNLKMVGGSIVEKSSKYLIRLDKYEKRLVRILKPFRKNAFFRIIDGGVMLY